MFVSVILKIISLSGGPFPPPGSWDAMEVAHLSYFSLTKEPALESEENHSMELGIGEGRIRFLVRCSHNSIPQSQKSSGNLKTLPSKSRC